MSSESSSRLRQFGLYKTIDSRTAEFLKLSRKRQIRRGCACAAVSSAITVTVVVGALLVYEFGFRSEATPHTARPSNWPNSVGKSASFEHKSPIQSNGKLLALILKSLDQNRYLEATVDDYSSQKPSIESTDYPFQKNIFAKSRKKPIGYKYPCVPQFGRKNSSEKARRIIDYQRVLTYLNSLSFRKKNDETPHIVTYSTQKASPVENYDILNQDYQASTTETKPAAIITPKPDAAPKQKPCCPCSNRIKLTEVLEKLYKSIQQLRALIVERKSNKDTFNNQHMTTAVKDEQSKYSSSTRANIRIQKTKHTTTTIIPQLKTTFEYSTVNIAKNYDKNEYKDYYIEEVETTTKLPNFHSTIANTNQKSVYVHTEPTTNTIGNENSPVGVVTTPQYAQYDFDDKVYTLMPVSFQDTAVEKKKKLFEDYKDLANYLGSLNKMKKIEFNSQLILDAIKEGPVKQRDYEQMFNHIEIDSPRLVSIPTEELKTQQLLEWLIGKPSQKVKDTADLNTFRNKLGSVENNKTPKSTLEHIPNKADHDLPLAPIFESFLASKKESGTILNLDETTTMSTKSQTDSSEDLTFNLRFCENSEESSILKTHSNSRRPPAKAALSHTVNGNEHDISLETHRTTPTKEAQKQDINSDKNVSIHKMHTITSTKDIPQHEISQNEDVSNVNSLKIIPLKEVQQENINSKENVSIVKTHILTSTKEILHHDTYRNEDEDEDNLNGHKLTPTKESQHENINSAENVNILKTHTKTPTKETQQHVLNQNKDLINLKGHNYISSKEAHQSATIKGTELNNLNTLTKTPDGTQNQDINTRTNKYDRNTVESSFKQTSKKANIISRIQSLEPTAIESNRAKSLFNEIPYIKQKLYMSDDEMDVDEFEAKLKTIINLNSSPIDYTALANTFLNEVDNSIEISQSMMPEEIRPSLLEIRRNHELFDADT